MTTENRAKRIISRYVRQIVNRNDIEKRTRKQEADHE